ncbi:MAG TPA: fibronectin type III domain-containing protein, partial [Cytophagaceae bacterium]
MQLEHILQAHGLIGRGRQSKPLPTIQNFRGNSNDLGTEIILNWDNPTVIEFQKVQIFMSDTDISNLSYDELILNGNMIVNAKVTTHTVTGLKHNDTRYFKAFCVFTILGEEKVSSGVSLVVTTKDIVPPSTITDFSAKVDNGQVTLTWVNPTDSDFSKVKILYKQGSYPSSPSDGMVAYEGSGNSVTVTGLTNDVEYYFRAFTYDTSGNINDSIDNQTIIATPTEQKIYGVEIDENNSNPETAVVYTDDAVGFTPARGNNGNFDWGSWEDIIKNEFKIRPCVLKNLGGGNAEVNYYLDYDDYTKKADGSAGVLDGTDGDVMVEFGVPLYWKFTRVDNKLKIQLSARPFEGAVKYAFEIEDGYNLVPFYPLTLTQILYVLMFKNLDSQTALGKGRTNVSSYTDTGVTNKKTFCYGSQSDVDNVKFLGIEDYWG